MKFSLEFVSDKNYIKSYGLDHIVVTSNNNSESFQLTSNLILSSHQIITDQLTGTKQKLTDSDLSILKSLEPELLIFETSSLGKVLSPELTAALSANAIGVEYMALGPACRTYNLLVTEGRRVVLVVNFL